MLLGIDEAGRGCLCGSMHVAGVCATKEVAGSWVLAGLKDSKQMKREDRDKLAERIKEECTCYEIVEIQAGEIDEENIDHLEFKAFLRLINNTKKIAQEIIIDCPGSRKTWWREFSDVIPEKTNFLKLEHKADENFPIVSAASVLAKNARDFHVDWLGVPNGGYWGDKLKEFLLAEVIKTGKLPDYVRKSWASVAKLNSEES